MTVWEVLQPWVARGGSLLFDFLKWQLFSFLVHEGLCLLADGDGSLRSQALKEEWFIVQRAHKRAVSKKLSRKALKKLIKKLGKEFGVWATLAVLLLENLSQVKSVLTIIAAKAVGIYAAAWTLSRAAAYSAHVYLRPWQAACAVSVAYALKHLLGLDLLATYSAVRPALHSARSLASAAARDVLHLMGECYRVACASLHACLARDSTPAQSETAKKTTKAKGRRRSIDLSFSSSRPDPLMAPSRPDAPLPEAVRQEEEVVSTGSEVSEDGLSSPETSHWRETLRRCRVDASGPCYLGRRRMPFRRRALHPLPPGRQHRRPGKPYGQRRPNPGQKSVWQPQKLRVRAQKPWGLMRRARADGSGSVDLTISRLTSGPGDLVFSLEQWPSLMADLIAGLPDEDLTPRIASGSLLRFSPLPQSSRSGPGKPRRSTVHGEPFT